MKVFVQIGAGAGDLDPQVGYRDGFTEYVKRQDSAEITRIILVEPNPVYIPFLQKCWEEYPQATIINMGICLEGEQGKPIRFYYAEKDAPRFQVFSMNRSDVQKHYRFKRIKETKVTWMTLHELHEQVLGDELFDFLAMDIEGIDAENILDTNWKKMNYHQISFEHLHLGYQAQIISETLIDARY